ncbi:matrin-type domain-containing protein, partial [Haematococcus lacustris]
MMAEQEDAVEEAAAGPDEGSDAEDEFVYNPLKLPLGWDGKPIPYWLYKLHGLNQEFKCEVCGNFSYWGRRAYEKHFKEFRHQNGMRALGIPNNKNFFEVTKIADAQKLWEDIQLKQKGGFKAETEEEYEDAAGNVYNKRTRSAPPLSTVGCSCAAVWAGCQPTVFCFMECAAVRAVLLQPLPQLVLSLVFAQAAAGLAAASVPCARCDGWFPACACIHSPA